LNTVAGTTIDNQESRAGRLVRSLTLTHAVLYGVGVTIGAGIYVLVGIAAGRSGMHAPVAFLAAAIAMGLTAASFAELGTRMPVSASEAAYVEAAFRRKWLSLLMGLLVVATATVSAATISSGSAGYIGVFISLPPLVIIVGVVLLMGAVASLATTHSVAVAGIMTLVEVGGLVVIIAAGLPNGTTMIARLPEMIPSPADVAAWVAVGGTTLIAVFAFVGFEHIVNVAEELKQPNRTLPRALFLTLGITAVLYMLVVWTAVTAVPPAELARSQAPLATVFERLTGQSLMFMSVIAVVATLNGVVVHMIMIARVLYGLSSQGNLPRHLSRVSPVTRTPLVATTVAVSVILVLSVAVPLEGLAVWAARGTLVIFAGVNVALIRIKRRGDQAPVGTFNCPTWVAYAGLITAVLLLVFDLAA
jgi:amino acid transporter